MNINNYSKPGFIFCIFFCSLLSGCVGSVEEIEISTTEETDTATYPNDISLEDGTPDCADSSSSKQPCQSGLEMRRVTSSNGYSDWIAFTSDTLEEGEIKSYEMNFDHEEFEFSRWSLSVSSEELTDPHIFLDWSSNGETVPIGGSSFDESYSSDSKGSSEYKDESWLDVDDDGKIIRTFQMTISFTEGVSLVAKVLDSDGSKGDFDMSITIYTNRKPVAIANLLSPSKVSQNSTIYVDGCKTTDPDFLDRGNDNHFGKLTWMLDSTEDSNSAQRISDWGLADCFLEFPLKGRDISLGKHYIYLLARDSATATDAEPDSIASVEFEIVPDDEYFEPNLAGQSSFETELKGEFEIDSLSPMLFFDLPFTRSDFSIGVGVRYKLELESEGTIDFEHIIDIENGTFDIKNASSSLDSQGEFRPWILVKYSIWDKDDRDWKDGEVEIPMLSCASIYDDMPSFKTPSSSCPQVYYWDKEIEIDEVEDGDYGNFEIDQTIDVSALNLFFLLEKFSSSNPAISSLLKLLNTIGDLEIPLTFGMNIDASGLMTTELNFYSNHLQLDGSNQKTIVLFGDDLKTDSTHELTGEDGFISLQTKSETLVEISMTPTIGIGVTYKFLGKTVLDYDYRWELPDYLAKQYTTNMYSTKCESILWEIES